jgi:AraC family transcriptional regulator
VLYTDRLEICAACDEVSDNPFGVVPGVLPAGRWSIVRHVGPEASLWERVRDLPTVLQRVRLFPDVPESEAVTDIWSPETR